MIQALQIQVTVPKTWRVIFDPGVKIAEIQKEDIDLEIFNRLDLKSVIGESPFVVYSFSGIWIVTLLDSKKFNRSDLFDTRHI